MPCPTINPATSEVNAAAVAGWFARYHAAADAIVPRLLALRTAAASPSHRQPRATFKDRDIKRIVKSVERVTGKSARRVEVDPQTGRVAVEVDSSATITNTWDEVLTDAEDKKRST